MRTPKDTQNPFRRLLDELSISSDELAILLGLSYGQVRHYIRGVVADVSPSVVQRLNELGIDGNAVRTQYAAWRKCVRAEILRRN